MGFYFGVEDYHKHYPDLIYRKVCVTTKDGERITGIISDVREQVLIVEDTPGVMVGRRIIPYIDIASMEEV